MSIQILDEAEDDLHDGREFYDRQAPGVGNYFAAALASGIIHLEVGFAPLKPAEFVFLRIRQSVASSGRLFKTPAVRAR